MFSRYDQDPTPYLQAQLERRRAQRRARKERLEERARKAEQHRAGAWLSWLLLRFK